MAADTVTPSAAQLAQWCSEAEALLAAGRAAETAAACRQLLAALPGFVEAHRLLGIAALEQRQVAAGLASLQRARALAPRRADIAAQLARALSLAQRKPEALMEAEAALALQPDSAMTLDTLGVVFSRANAHARAVRLFAHAAALVPSNAGYQFNLATAHKFAGDFEAAETAYEACLAADPQYWKAYPTLSQLRRQTPERNHRARYEALLPKAQTVEAALQLRMALFKECEDLGDYAAAFTYLSEGKAARRRELGYDFAQDAALFDGIQAQNLATLRGPGHDSTEPIFVIGMPRSGTTLVERILSSHPAVHSAGELQNFGLAFKRASGSRSRQMLDADTLSRSGQVDFAAVGKAYVDSTRPDTGHTPHFVDKMPLNFLYAGFIHRALPKAKIVCLRRNAWDACLSNFRQLFALQFSYYNYSYDLLDCGRYYRAFDLLLQHWQRTLPGVILEVRYERLVAEPEAETRRLLAHCGLAWDDACLAFERNQAPVSTASAVQVRQPLYRSAVERHRHYQSQLAPLTALLEGFGYRADDPVRSVTAP